MTSIPDPHHRLHHHLHQLRRHHSRPRPTPHAAPPHRWIAAAAAVAVVVSSAVWSAGSTIRAAAPAGVGRPAIAAIAAIGTTIPMPSPLGTVRYDDTSDCGAEVAYVDDRIVAAGWNPALVAKRIDSLVGVKSGTALVDTLTFPADSGLPPVHLFDLPGTGGQAIVDLARQLHAAGVDAAPDYVTMLAGGKDFFQPNSIPVPTRELPTPRTAPAPNLGAGVDIVVFDSGLATTPYGNLIPNVSVVDPIDVEEPDADGDGHADDDWVGHGLAISSEVAALVPGASIADVRITRRGIASDFTAAKAMVTTLTAIRRRDLPEVLIASFGTLACDLDPMAGTELRPTALAGATTWITRTAATLPEGMALVASAGNHGTTRMMYPAAFDDVIAVGAIDATVDGDSSPLTSSSRSGPVAGFSARGPWVDFYAPGVAIVALHVDGLEFSNGAVVDGSAEVEGTSFAGPFVGAAIAEVMSRQRVPADVAAELLAQSGSDPLPPCDGSPDALGDGAAIALVDLASAVDAPAVDEPATGC